MIYFVYIIYSEKLDRYYVGQTDDLNDRVKTHRKRKNLGGDDWVLKYSENYGTRSEAVKRELEIKKKKRRAYIEWLINSKGSTEK